MAQARRAGARLFRAAGGGHAWAMIFLAPIAITVVAAIAFRGMFDEQRYRADSEAVGVASSE